MMSALLHHHLTARGVQSTVTSAGTAAELLAPIPGVSEQLYRLGMTLPPYIGRQVNVDVARHADLIVTAEPDHVVWIAGRLPDVFPKAYTLPELVNYASQVGHRQNSSLKSWLANIAELRPSPRSNLEHQGVQAIPDPTGAPEQVWIEVADRIDGYCQQLAELLA
jgi:protein-tyrosine-phosphatase